MFKTLTWDKVVRKLTSLRSLSGDFIPCRVAHPYPRREPGRGTLHFIPCSPSGLQGFGLVVRQGSATPLPLVAPLTKSARTSGERSRNKAEINDCFYKFINYLIKATL
jgi:hypothetical protein